MPPLLSVCPCERVSRPRNAQRAFILCHRANPPVRVRLYNMAVKIQARAIRRGGELLKEYDARPLNAKQSNGNGTLISQRDAAKDAGLSKRKQVTAVRVANVPSEQFESLVESEAPPTMTGLAMWEG